MQKPKWGIAQRNEGNAENKGGNARNRMGMRVRGISLGMGEIQVEMQNDGYAGNQSKNLSIAVEMTQIMTQSSSGNDKFKERREVEII